MNEPSGPLADITIIDCTMALAGPFGAAILADLGANVIKVEPPGGDVARSVPPLPEDYANANSDQSAGCDFGGYFASVNRNKRSVVIDLKTPAGRETLLALCDKADAIIENIDYPALMLDYAAASGVSGIRARAAVHTPSGPPTTSWRRAWAASRTSRGLRALTGFRLAPA